MKTLSSETASYIAGLFDGEGCIHISKHFGRNSKNMSHTLKVMVVMTDEHTIRQLRELTGVGFVFHDAARNKKNANWHDVWEWICSSNEAAQFLTAIYSKLVLKKDQADTALEFQNLKTHRAGRYGEVQSYIVEKREHLRLKLMSQKSINRPQVDQIEEKVDLQMPLF